MKLVRHNIFAPKIAEKKEPLALRTTSEVATLVQHARQSGGWLGGWRMQRTADAASLQNVQHALEAYFAAKREEITYRIALSLDAAKKRAVTDNLEETAITEREMARMSATIDDELKKSVFDIAKAASLEEVQRIRDLKASLDRGEITARRYERECERIERRTDEVVERAEQVADRVIQNLGERLDAALRSTQGGNY